MHERQAIREAVATLLTGTAPDYATSAEARVFKTRIAPLPKHQLPAVNVYIYTETITPEDGTQVERNASLVIEGYVRVSESVDDEIDDLSLEIETAMDGDPTLAGKVSACRMSSSEIQFTTLGDRPVGVIQIEYDIAYVTTSRVADPTDIFDTADVKFDLDGNQLAADQTEDLIEDINQE